jgi:hypothetical protein
MTASGLPLTDSGVPLEDNADDGGDGDGNNGGRGVMVVVVMVMMVVMEAGGGGRLMLMAEFAQVSPLSARARFLLGSCNAADNAGHVAADDAAAGSAVHTADVPTADGAVPCSCCC